MYEKSSELIIKIQGGDETAIEKIFNMYKGKAVRTAYLLTGNRDLAEDIVQEIFIKCFKNICELKVPQQFKTWFFKTLTRTAWKTVKKEKKTVPVENIFEMGEYEDSERTDLELIRKEDAKILQSAIDKLEIKQKSVISLYYYSEFSVSEIAKIMGCFEGTVKSRLFTARKNLKKV